MFLLKYTKKNAQLMAVFAKGCAWLFGLHFLGGVSPTEFELRRHIVEENRTSPRSTRSGPVGSRRPPDVDSLPTEFDSLHLSRIKQGRHQSASLVLLVEPRRIELLSEKLLIGLSPGAECLQIFPAQAPTHGSLCGAALLFMTASSTNGRCTFTTK